MTLILNVLHKDMSILAADGKAIAEWPVSAGSVTTAPSGRGCIVQDFNKITLNSTRTLALGIAGSTQDHGYTQVIERSSCFDEGLYTIRRHMEGFVPVYDRATLSTLTSFTANEGIASFFDQSMGMYFTSKYLFSPVEIRTRLHRANDDVKVFSSGSGSKYFEGENGLADIESLITLTKCSCTPEACISWLKDAFKRVGDFDPESGVDPMFVVSTRSNPKFHSI